jgi:hypothetical protein
MPRCYLFLSKIICHLNKLTCFIPDPSSSLHASWLLATQASSLAMALSTGHHWLHCLRSLMFKETRRHRLGDHLKSRPMSPAEEAAEELATEQAGRPAWSRST